jgi:hypothetical protein
MVVLGHNLRMFSEKTGNGVYEGVWSRPFGAAVPNSYVSRPSTKVEKAITPPDAMDPFGVTGTYMRVSSYCA